MINSKLGRNQIKKYKKTKKIRKSILIPCAILSGAVLTGSLAVLTGSPENKTGTSVRPLMSIKSEDPIPHKRTNKQKQTEFQEKMKVPVTPKAVNDRDLSKILKLKFPPDSIICESREERFPKRLNSFSLISRYSHGPHSFNRRNYPEDDDGMLDLIEHSSRDKLLKALSYLAKIGIAGFDGNGVWSPKILHYGRLMVENRGRISFDMQCLSKSGEGYLYATAIMVRLVNMEYEADRPDIMNSAEKIPDNLNEPFYELLSIRLFREENFDPEATADFISGMTENQKSDLFDRLYDFVYINDSFRKTVGEVQSILLDRSDSRTAARLGSILRRAERNDC